MICIIRTINNQSAVSVDMPNGINNLWKKGIPFIRGKIYLRFIHYFKKQAVTANGKIVIGKFFPDGENHIAINSIIRVIIEFVKMMNSNNYCQLSFQAPAYN